MSGDPVEYIEYIYTSYKMPASADITSGGANLAQAIADKVFPDETKRGGRLLKIVHDDKNYICGFVSNVNDNKAGPTKEYFVTVEVGTDDKVQHVNCYKCTFGNLTDTNFVAGWDGITKDGYVIFGYVENANEFRNPPHSFFLEGDHEAYNDLPAGSYSGDGVVTLLA